MFAIEFRFPSGRYHATPWQHHVNEGLVEWPPSPWRLIRALLATWHHKSSGEVGEEAVRALAMSLSSSLPRFALPAGTLAHTRHYMPIGGNKTTKVIDAFLDLRDDARLVAAWNVDLPAEARDAAEILVPRIAYLGRAESWVDARTVDDVDWERLVAQPTHGAIDRELERTSVIAPLMPEEYEPWRAAALDERHTRKLAELRRKAAVRGKPVDKVKLSKKQREGVEELLPPDLFAALHADNGVLHKQGWSQPPGSRFVDYQRPALEAPRRARPRRSSRRSTVARFALAGAVPPRLVDAVLLAEKVRTVLLARSDGSPVFAGRDGAGRRLEGHQHAHLLPEAHGRAGRITHLSLYAPMGFDERARRALDSLRGVWGRRGYGVDLVLTGVGAPEDFAGRDVALGESPLFIESAVWRSSTPFVATRHLRRRRDGRPRTDETGLAIGSPEHDLRRLWALRGLPAIKSIEPLEHAAMGGRPTRWLAFRTERSRGDGRRGGNAGVGFRVELAQPVRGPIALGYGAHFGLGLFEPGEMF